jgi:uncharacterized membrane protein (DUF485 family)
MVIVRPVSEANAAGDPLGAADVAALVAMKLRYLTPMIAVYLAVYVGLSILCGFAKPLLGTKVLGPINLGFALIALNYLLSWLLAVVYARFANRVLDPLVQAIAAMVERERERA